MAQSTLQGIVLDAESKEVLIGANIVIQELNRGISTNQKGEFQFENIKKKEYNLQVSFVGYYG